MTTFFRSSPLGNAEGLSSGVYALGRIGRSSDPSLQAICAPIWSQNRHRYAGPLAFPIPLVSPTLQLDSPALRPRPPILKSSSLSSRSLVQDERYRLIVRYISSSSAPPRAHEAIHEKHPLGAWVQRSPHVYGPRRGHRPGPAAGAARYFRVRTADAHRDGLDQNRA